MNSSIEPLKSNFAQVYHLSYENSTVELNDLEFAQVERKNLAFKSEDV